MAALTQVTESLYGPWQLSQEVAGELQGGEEGHGGELRGQQGQLVVRQVQHGDVRQEAQVPGQALGQAGVGQWT